MADDQVFIISWRGQHENACLIANELKSDECDVHIVFSDPDPNIELNTKANLLRRDNSGFAGDKFQACFDAFSGERLLVICADCTCDNWRQVVSSGFACLRSEPDIWVWAPHIEHSGFALNRAKVMNLSKNGLIAVAHTDTIVFGWAQPVIERLRQASLINNTYGWGVGWMAISFAYTHGKWAVVDPSIKVQHPKGRGYRTQDAAKQRGRFLMQLEPHEKFICRLLSAHLSSSH